MKRRDFFKLGMQKATAVVVDEAEAHVSRRARQWIRPPFAAPELDFLLKCTRCGDCIEACPHDVLFPLSAKFGLEAVSTPAMDLTQVGCRLCHDWPCVQACAPGALFGAPIDEIVDAIAVDKLDEIAEKNSAFGPVREMPKLADVKIIESRCLPYAGPECGACAHCCPVDGALLWDGPKPYIDRDQCTGCAMCVEACITEPKAIRVCSVAHSPG